MSFIRFGIYLDPKANFGSHTLMVARRANEMIKLLENIMPNTRQHMRKLLAVVPHFELLYDDFI